MQRSVGIRAEWQVQGVFASNIKAICQFYHQYKGIVKETDLDTTFGMPFLIVKHKNELVGFASLIIDAQNSISYVYHGNGAVLKDDALQQQIMDHFTSQKNLFNTEAHLQSGINDLLHWLNLSYN